MVIKLITKYYGVVADNYSLRQNSAHKKVKSGQVKSGQVRFILPVKIGEANISDQVTGDMIRQVLGNGE